MSDFKLNGYVNICCRAYVAYEILYSVENLRAFPKGISILEVAPDQPK